LSEKLIIRNFGPIVNVELDLRRVNVLIGESGTGKSTVAKVLAVIKKCLNNININDIKDYTNVGIENDFSNEFLLLFRDSFLINLERFDLANYLSNETRIAYNDELFDFNLSEGALKLSCKNFQFDKVFFGDNNIFYFIPAFRESYILLRNSYPALLNSEAKLPYLLNQFGQYFNNFREQIKVFRYKGVLGVDYKFQNGSDLIEMSNGKIIKFEESSSAINSVVPMLVTFDGLIQKSKDSFSSNLSGNLPYVAIEEPELNCFPTTQKKVVNHFIENIKHNGEKYYCNLILTSHSPYILTSLNNLMYAYEVGKQHAEEVEKVIERKYWLNPNDVAAYELKTDGTCEDIFNREENLISAGRIDEISNTLNEQFDELLNIELVPR
jgi:energy-coupling factor transporter ATP-binding protein EcfA2